MNKQRIATIVKSSAILVAGIACATVAGAVIKNIVPIENLTKYNKVMVVIGTGILGGIAAEAGSNYAESFVGAFEDMFNGIQLAINANKLVVLEEPEEG